MTADRKQRICTMLKGIETGDPASVNVINPTKYIQHNPQTNEGRDGLAVLFKRLSTTDPRVNIVRIFSDGDFVFGHTEYDFSNSRVGFEVFRFEGEFAVEHWDNIQTRQGPNPSGHSMVDGETTVTDIENTETNRELVKRYTEQVLINRNFDKLADFLSSSYREHDPELCDGLTALQSALNAAEPDGTRTVHYQNLHRVLAEGNFVLSVCEGHLKGDHASFYDLYRIADGKIVERWNTREKIPPRSQWVNDNGKF